MLIHPWDAVLDSAEWQDWLAATGRFGMLAVNNFDPARAPLVLPLHFSVAGDELLMHLARPNPVWPHLEAAAEVRLAVTGDYAYIPTYWNGSGTISNTAWASPWPRSWPVRSAAATVSCLCPGPRGWACRSSTLTAWAAPSRRSRRSPCILLESRPVRQ